MTDEIKPSDDQIREAFTDGRSWYLRTLQPPFTRNRWIIKARTLGFEFEKLLVEPQTRRPA